MAAWLWDRDRLRVSADVLNCGIGSQGGPAFRTGPRNGITGLRWLCGGSWYRCGKNVGELGLSMRNGLIALRWVYLYGASLNWKNFEGRVPIAALNANASGASCRFLLARLCGDDLTNSNRREIPLARKIDIESRHTTERAKSSRDFAEEKSHCNRLYRRREFHAARSFSSTWIFGAEKWTILLNWYPHISQDHTF
jgi:hypothetical protein